MSDRINKRKKTVGRVDRSQRRKLGHMTERCVHCKAINPCHATVCWKCGKPV